MDKSVKRARKITFAALYKEACLQPTAAQRFISDIAALTSRSEVTVKAWAYGSQTPDPLVRSVIANYLGAEADSLFLPCKSE